MKPNPDDILYGKLCPECGHQVQCTMEGDNYAVFCGYGPCRSSLSNDGGVGETKLEAYKAFTILVEAGELEKTYE